MNPIQESKQELEASIRYAENAIAKAKQAIEQAATYQEQTGREQALQNQVGELKSECALLAERIDEMKDSAFASANTIKHLKEVKQELESKVQGQYDDIKKLEYDLVAKTAQANAWKKKYYDFKETLVRAGDPRVVEDKPTMPVIPKAVAIAIFREGVQHGVEAACTELEGQTIMVEESEYVHNFEVSFTKEIDLDNELDLDWMRDKVGDYSEETVIDALGTLCADKEFECRIHGVDDTTIDLTKKNDE